ncbi:MAG: hypothetical protein AAF683_01640 [Pseudomonadota bacterium]
MSKVIQLHENERKRRTGERPGFIRDALRWRSDKRWGTHRFAGTNVSLRCHSDSWTQVGDYLYPSPYDGQPWIKRQSRFGWIEIDGKAVGALDATRYDADTLINTEDFVLIMDIDRADEAAFGVILGNAWYDIGTDVTDYGTIIHLNWAWTDPAVKIGIPAHKMFEKLLKPWLASHAIIVLQAFPLEYLAYGGRDGEDAAKFEIAFRRRRRALVKLLEKSGFELFPGKAGNEGWMLRIADRLKDHIPPPKTGQLKIVMNRDQFE